MLIIFQSLFMKNGINHKVKGGNLKDASNFHLYSQLERKIQTYFLNTLIYLKHILISQLLPSNRP